MHKLFQLILLMAFSVLHAPNGMATDYAYAQALERGSSQVHRDLPQAVQLYCKLAQDGHAAAQFRLGWLLANGQGMPRDDAAAAYFVELAVRQGHPQALRLQRTLAGIEGKAPPCVFDHLGNDLVAAAEPKKHKMLALIQRLAPEYGIHPRLAIALVSAESAFNPTAVSPKNAQGLMQLIPETAERFGVRKVFDPEQNIRGGLAYLRWLLAYFEGDLALSLAGYNAGEGAVERYRGVPPYPETQNYVKRILKVYSRETHPFNPAVTPPSGTLETIKKRLPSIAA